MRNTAQTTDTLSMFPIDSCTLVREDFCKVSYSSRFLLPASFPDVVVNDAVYAQWCEDGFEAYFDGIGFDSHAVSSLSSLKAFLIHVLFSDFDDDRPLAERVGFLSGGLSALAFTDRALALAGLDILMRLTDHLVFLSSGVVL